MSRSASRVLTAALLISSLLGCGTPTPTSEAPTDPHTAQEQEIQNLLDSYLETYLTTFPSRATAAGDHRQDRFLEDFSPEKLDLWIAENQRVRDQLATFLNGPDGEGKDSTESEIDIHSVSLRLDAEIIHRRASRELFRFQTLDQSRQDPLFWSSVLGSTAVFLLVRDDLPLADRLDRLADRTALIPRFCQQAQTLLSQGSPDRIVADHARMAAGRMAASASFFAERLMESAATLEGENAEALRLKLDAHGRQAAEALNGLSAFLDELAANAGGDPRLGDHYAQSFYLGTGIRESVAEVEERAEADLRAAVKATASYCRSIWPEIVGETGGAPPEDEAAVVRACFQRIGQDRVETVDEFVEYYRVATQEAHAFVRQAEILTPPGPLTLTVDRSPAFLAGQSVGGIYPSGPFSPEAHALLFVPTLPDSAPREMKDAFYGDFNLHFNRMITPHETTPGHYAQGKLAALGDSKLRAMFSDGVYVEGWGTFSELIMLDHGWGDPLTRVAHFKKRLENIARTLVDIRVHTGKMDRQQMLDFLRDQAFQDGQFAINMWTRATTSSPQLTTYYLGFRDISELYRQWRAAHPNAPPRDFSDRMMSLGPVPVRYYRPLFQNPLE